MRLIGFDDGNGEKWINPDDVQGIIPSEKGEGSRVLIRGRRGHWGYTGFGFEHSVRWKRRLGCESPSGW